MKENIRKPDFFIVGAPKCGTTAMYNYLRQHPEIFMPPSKELHYFGKDLHFSFKRLSKVEYQKRFAKVKDEKRIGEASVWYLYSKSAAREIKEYNPNAKIIIMIRNPVDMMYSNHSQFVFNGNENVDDFSKALELENERKKGRNIPDSSHFIEGLFYRKTAKFTEQIKRYFDTFGRDSVHVILFDDLKNDTIAIYRKTLEFLGVDKRFEPSFNIINANKKVRSLWMMKITRFPPPVVSRVSELLVPRKIRKLFTKLLIKLNTKYVPRPPMNPLLRTQLLNEFRPEIEKLSTLLAVDLSLWCED